MKLELVIFWILFSIIFQIQHAAIRTFNLKLDFAYLINIYVLMFGHIKVCQSYDKPEVKISHVITNGLCKLKINCISTFSRKYRDFVSKKAFWPSR